MNKTEILLTSNNYPFLKCIQDDFDISTEADIKKLNIKIKLFYIIKKNERHKTKKIFIQVVEINGLSCDPKIIKKNFGLELNNLVRPLFFIYRECYFGDTLKIYSTGRVSEKNAIKFVESYCSEKTKISKPENFDNPLYQNHSNYIFIKARKLFSSNLNKDEPTTFDDVITPNLNLFLQVISSLELVQNYVKTFEIEKGFMFEELSKDFFDLIKRYLKRLEYITNNPECNKLYVFQNHCDSVIKNILNYNPERTKNQFEMIDERIELTKKVCCLLPFKYAPKNSCEIIELDELKDIYDKLDEIEDVNNNFFIKEKSCVETSIIKQVVYSKDIETLVELDKSDERYKPLYNFFNNNWGSNHLHFKKGVELKAIFEVRYSIGTKVESEAIGTKVENEARGESEVIRTKVESEVTLLLHGSNVINWKSIINNGMKIPAHPGMFGKGIYFANCFGKSYAYCGRQPDQHCVLGLYEVCLGKKLKLVSANNSLTSETLPKGYDSVWGQGSSSYNQFDIVSGAKLYKNHFTKTSQKFDLLHDEFIIYDPNRCRLKYLFFL